jgi:uncharacterized protein involved in response to NO
MSYAENASGRERKLQTLVTAYVVTGLLFLLLPGTFLGVWNLISISNRQALDQLSPAWLQAHGHAQIFGWIGTFILGIGFYSLPKMGQRAPFAPAWGWVCLALWTTGLLVRWSSTITTWHWRILVPFASALELTAFLFFFRMVSRHRPERRPTNRKQKPEAWMHMMIASTLGFLLTLTANAMLAFFFALRDEGPALPHGIDQEMVIFATWGFLVPAVWGLNARWLPVFLGLEAPRPNGLFTALGLAWGAVIAALAGYLAMSVALMPIAAATAIWALHAGILQSDRRKQKVFIQHSHSLCARRMDGWRSPPCLPCVPIYGTGMAASGARPATRSRWAFYPRWSLQSASEFCLRFAG